MSTCPVEIAAGAHADAPALHFGGATWTWKQVNARVGSLVEELRGAGVRGGHAVAISGHNRPDALFAHFACARMNACAAPIHARLLEPEQAALIQRVKPAALITASGIETATARPTPIHAAALLFTSGTTGTPRGALLSRRALEASARASALVLGGESSTWLMNLPLFHVGAVAMAWRWAIGGGTLVMHERFDAAATWSDLQHHGVTHLSLVPTTLARLLDHHAVRAPSTLRVVLVGGGPVAARRMEEARARGFPVAQTYGLTEACSQVCTQRPGHGDESAGPPLPGTEVRIDDAGLVCVRGPTLMDGYLDDPGATAAALRDGWLHTGDYGRIDDNRHLHVLSRRTDLVIRGGENVYPGEVERVVLRHPDIEECVVLPVPDPTWGQVPHAWVKVRADVGAEQLRTWCVERLAPFKVPTRFHVLAELPRNAMGKVDRAALRMATEDA